LAPTGAILGGFAGVEFRSEVVDLEAGDVIAIFTDGLTEAGTSRSEMLGVEGVSEILAHAALGASSPDEIVTRMMSEAEKAATPAGFRDDICLLVLRIE
jgi:sigma-B regulation protein RsbU (phosphoserine phosphatase)